MSFVRSCLGKIKTKELKGSLCFLPLFFSPSTQEVLSTMGVILLIRQGVLGEQYGPECKILLTHAPGVTTLFSLIVLAISAHLISQTQQYFRITATFCALGVAVAVISLVTLPVMLVAIISYTP